MHASHVSRLPVGSILLGAFSTFSLGWLAYYAAQDTIRRVTVRSRKSKFPLQIRPKGFYVTVKRRQEGREASVAEFGKENGHTATPKHSSSVTASSSWHGGARAQELLSIQKRFAPLKILRRYVNPFPEWRETGVWEFVYYKLVHSMMETPRRIAWDGGLSSDKASEAGRKKIDTILQVQSLDRAKLWGGQEAEPCAEAEGMTYTWIGQSTCLIQMNGLTILTDPVFSFQPIESMFSPTRMAPMPCTIEELTGTEGKIDVVLISHNHFDHLQLDILPLFPKSTRWIVPKGVAPLLIQAGLNKDSITELSWWEDTESDFTISARQCGKVESVARSLKVTAAPSMHWTGRNLFDVNASLWCSYVVRVGPSDKTLPIRERSFFFCCDSGYSPLTFSSIGRALGPVDAAAIPIGSYKPRWFMSIQHGDPRDALHIAADVGAQRSFATHWGTWSMSDERWDEPVYDLKKALRQEKLPEDFLITLPFGKTVDVS